MATTKPKLSATQRRLVKELNEIADLFNLSPTSILEEDPDSWTPRLRLAKDQLVRSQVVVWYALVDEFLNSRIAHYFFSRRRSFPELWRTKRFKLFKKVRFVKAIEVVPKPIVADIERLNALRNGLAHAFFPENLKKVKPEWKGQSILTIQALERFGEDMQRVFDHFLPV